MYFQLSNGTFSDMPQSNDSVRLNSGLFGVLKSNISENIGVVSLKNLIAAGDMIGADLSMDVYIVSDDIDKATCVAKVGINSDGYYYKLMPAFYDHNLVSISDSGNLCSFINKMVSSNDILFDKNQLVFDVMGYADDTVDEPANNFTGATASNGTKSPFESIFDDVITLNNNEMGIADAADCFADIPIVLANEASYFFDTRLNDTYEGAISKIRELIKKGLVTSISVSACNNGELKTVFSARVINEEVEHSYHIGVNEIGDFEKLYNLMCEY